MKNIHIPTIEELLRSDEEFSVEKIADGYRIRGVQYRHGGLVYDIGTELLPIMTQDRHAEFARCAKPDKHRATCVELIHTICKTLYQNRNGQQKELIEEVRAFLQRAFQNRLHTLSQVAYQPGIRPDITFHEIGQPWQYSVGHKMRHQTDQFKIEGADPQDCDIILRDANPGNINNVYKWIIQKETMLKLAQTPEKGADLRAVALGLTEDVWGREYFSIIATENPNTMWHALGIRWKGKA